LKAHDILFIAGGIGMAPLRTLLLYMLDNREDYGDIMLIYGARSPEDLCYTYEFDEWRSGGVRLVLTVDREFPGWKERVGFVPTVLTEEAPSSYNCKAVTCGPPIMIKFVLIGLKRLDFEDHQIITTLEKRMKCGIGICGRCNIGTKYVCVDGPVFSYEELRQMVPEI
ncbi:MAG: heterodisulfide reductase subunit F, partial [Desulfobacterales bacterium]